MSEARIGRGAAGLGPDVDLVVAGLGVTGAGVALDAAARGLSVLAVDSHDVAFGTSRWSSKLVHGGLRYLARLQVAIAHESAVERGLLLERTAPHLTRPLPMLLPLLPQIGPAQAVLASAGLRAGDLLRRRVGTSAAVLPPPRRVSATGALGLAPALRSSGLRGGLLGWDGQLVDDARLVVCLARTAVAHGAEVRTGVRVVSARPGHVRLRDTTTGGDQRTGQTVEVRCRAVVNATGVWAAESGLDPDLRLRPSRGTHLVVRSGTLGNLDTALVIAVPGAQHRYVIVLPQLDGRVVVGLTDEPADAPVPDVPRPTEPEIGFLLDVVATALATPLRRDDVAGAYAGLRPLLDDGERSTADLSRAHAVRSVGSGVVTVVGGKLTTYRRMAADAVDATGLTAASSPTASLPLLGAASRDRLSALSAPPTLVRRHGTEAELVLERAAEATGWDAETLSAPIVDGSDTTRAELVFGVTHEGAGSVGDLLDRRTRMGLIPADRAAAEPVAREVLDRVGETLRRG